MCEYYTVLVNYYTVSNTCIIAAHGSQISSCNLINFIITYIVGHSVLYNTIFFVTIRLCLLVVAGSTVASWQLLRGRKEEGTDTHSYTARILGISRDNAKVFNYGRLYGAGFALARLLLLQFNPQLSDAEASKLAREVYRRTNGIKRFARTKNATGTTNTAADTKGTTDANAATGEKNATGANRKAADSKVANDGANTADTAHTAESQSAAATKGTKKKDKRVQVDADDEKDPYYCTKARMSPRILK